MWALVPGDARARRELRDGAPAGDARLRHRDARRVRLRRRGASVSSSTAASVERHSEALRDPLTGLPNRVLLDDRIEQAFRRSRRSGEPFTLIAIDLDGFKDVNDVRGHRRRRRRAEDARAPLRGGRARGGHGRARRRRRVRRALDRHGQRRPRGALVGRLRNALRRPFKVDGAAVEIDGSIGWAVFPDDGATAEELLARADGQMYATKRDTSDENVAAPPRRRRQASSATSRPRSSRTSSSSSTSRSSTCGPGCRTPPRR